MKKTSFVIVMLLFAIASTYAQRQLAPNIYWIQLADKNNSPYSIDRPEEFLSQRAIERRTKYDIPVTEQDLPVNAAYLDKLREIGLKIHNVSRWFNAVAVETSDYAKVEEALQLPFVRAYKPIWNGMIYMHETTELPEIETNAANETEDTENVYDYGSSAGQITIMNGNYLHNQGFSGQGMQIAVIDAGFHHVDQLPAFDSLWANNQILGTRDFVDGGKVNFSTPATHGMQVLSTIGGNIPGKLVGTAPKASFWLMRSEDSNSEYPVEEFNWIAAAEYADSIGIDVINSSLGYSEFDDEEYDYNYNQMNGTTAYITQAANIAAIKGILVVTSAGNSGADSWKYITAPADAYNALTIGAVSNSGEYAYFSSRGPTYDKRVKPNVCGVGSWVTVQSSSEGTTFSNGTSFSSPIMAGAVTCLWQAYPEMTNFEIMEAVEKSASQYTTPDTYYGYGIPDFKKASRILSQKSKNNN